MLQLKNPYDYENGNFYGIIPLYVFFIIKALRTDQRDVLDHLHCVALSRLLHLSGGLPGFLCLVEVEDVVEK